MIERACGPHHRQTAAVFVEAGQQRLVVIGSGNFLMAAQPGQQRGGVSGVAGTSMRSNLTAFPSVRGPFIGGSPAWIESSASFTAWTLRRLIPFVQTEVASSVSTWFSMLPPKTPTTSIAPFCPVCVSV